MKARLQQWNKGFAAMGIAAVVLLAVYPARGQETNAPVQIKSVFEEPKKAGYTDPFFPKTQRIKVNQPVQTEAAVAAPAPTVSIDQIRLQGISLGAQEKTAMINNKTLGEGESATVKLPKGTAQVQVLEIRSRSVVIKIDSDPEAKEIYLRPL